MTPTHSHTYGRHPLVMRGSVSNAGPVGRVPTGNEKLEMSDKLISQDNHSCMNVSSCFVLLQVYSGILLSDTILACFV